MLELININQRKGFKRIFRKLNLNISKGDFAYLLYSDEEEKLCFMNLLCNQNKLKNGMILIKNKDINRLSEEEFSILRQEISTVHGDFKLISSKSAYGNLRYVVDMLDEKNRLSEDKIDKILDFFGLLHKKHDYPEKLDSREKQILALVRAIVRGSDLFILEDPTKFLKKDDREKLMLFLEKLNKRGKTVFFVTDDMSLPVEYPHNIFKLEKGAIL